MFLRGFVDIPKIPKQILQLTPTTHPPTHLTTFFCKPITDMDGTLKQ